MIQNWKFQRGDIFFTRFDNAIGSEQSGNRPAVVLQNDVGNFYSPTLIVATLTSKAAKKYTQPTHCLLVNEFLSVPSIKSSFEDAGSVEDTMLYTELEAAVHAMIQRLEYSFTFNPSLLTIPKRKQQVAEILKEAETYIWRIKEEMRCA